ncbi:MAG: hypothetical protein OEV87_11050, partial [Phycisphaerae bacterium]|nr:hypothetical protein [Phycisphaerae bacterium]
TCRGEIANVISVSKIGKPIVVIRKQHNPYEKSRNSITGNGISFGTFYEDELCIGNMWILNVK